MPALISAMLPRRAGHLALHAHHAPEVLWQAGAVAALVALARIARRRGGAQRDSQRAFSAPQRQAIFARCGGRCEHKSPLWRRCPRAATQADHVHPWSRGGPTSLANAQGLSSAISSHNAVTLVSWVSQTFLQLVLLSVIIVGQNELAAAADKRAEATYYDTDAVLHEVVKLQEHPRRGAPTPCCRDPKLMTAVVACRSSVTVPTQGLLRWMLPVEQSCRVVGSHRAQHPDRLLIGTGPQELHPVLGVGLLEPRTRPPRARRPRTAAMISSPPPAAPPPPGPPD